MISLTVNGIPVQSDEDITLLAFLRDSLGLTAAKDGCSEGVCGTCTVLVDGKKVKACTQTLSRFEGKSVQTVEGLSPREKEVYVYCFGEAGAVQCGFCTPGMVICAKALLDSTLTPTREEVKAAIRGNICRCTGYKKIEEAILLAARFFREDLPIPALPNSTGVNRRLIRPDVAEKVLGTGQFVGDLHLPNMLFAKALRSRYPRARVNRIDLNRAEQHPECVRILTAKDVPYNKTGHIVPDWDVMIAEGDITRYIGDAIALVCTRTERALDEVLALIDVDYTELTPVSSPLDALAADAPLLHKGGNIVRRETLKRGDADAAIRNSKYVDTKNTYPPVNDHPFLQPQCAIALPEGEDGILLYSGAQGVYDEKHEIAAMLRIPEEKVHCHSMLVGGGFGGKEDMSVQHHAALMAWHVKAPVKVQFSRQESLEYHTKRHPMHMEFTTACDETGKLTAMKAVLIADSGAYASLGGPVLQRACTHAAGPYNYQNIDILGISVYTNNVVAGAYRGFGVTQSCFATENNLNLLAEMVGISPWEIRYRNAVRPGQELPNGQLADGDCALAECLLAIKDVYESSPYAGIACAFKNSGKGIGIRHTGRCKLSIESGLVHIRTSAACMGQGIATVCTQIICEQTGLDPKLLLHERADTVRTPDSGTSTASRQTVITGEAARKAGEALQKALESGKTLADLEGQEFYGEYVPITDPMGTNKPNPVSHVSYSYGAQVVVLNKTGKVERVVWLPTMSAPRSIFKVLKGRLRVAS